MSFKRIRKINFSALMDNNVYVDLFKRIFITGILALALSVIFNKYYQFNEETLLWMTSTIVQAFGALIAIVIAIGIAEKDRISKKVEKNFGTTNKGTTRLKRGGNFKEGIKSLKEQDNLWKRLFSPIYSMVFLIIISLFVMMFIKSSVVFADYLLCFIFVFLFLFSAYTLNCLIKEIFKAF